MNSTFETLRIVQLIVFGGLALLTMLRWLRRRGRGEAWLAGIFAILGGIIAVGFFIPRDASGTLEDALMRKALLAVLLFFPYALFRFADSIDPHRGWVRSACTGLTIAACLVPFALGPLPDTEGPRTLAWGAYVVLMMVQWVFCSLAAGIKLWRRGKNQPTVIRRRMRSLSLGTFGLALAIIVSVTFGRPGEVSLARIVTLMIGVLCGPLFVLGATPPAWVIMLWRRPEVAVMREAVKQLMGAETTEQIANSLLAPAVRVVGGEKGVFVFEGNVIASVGVEKREGPRTLARLEQRVAQGDETVLWMRLRKGALCIALSPCAPLLGDREEIELLRSTAILADLAFERVGNQEKERAATVAQRDFLAVASHDLRTPLAVIQGYTGLMNVNWADIPDEEKIRFNERIDRQARHLARLVDDLLVSSRLEARALYTQPVDVPLLPEVLKALEVVGTNAATVDVDVPESIVVRIDPEHLQRVLVNLLTNALEHGQSPVEVTAATEGMYVEICVRDHGPGVSPEAVPGLFQRFARVGSGPGRAPGTGLGLYIVDGLMREVGGFVAYETPPSGIGARFRVSIPVASVIEDSPEGERWIAV